MEEVYDFHSSSKTKWIFFGVVFIVIFLMVMGGLIAYFMLTNSSLAVFEDGVSKMSFEVLNRLNLNEKNYTSFEEAVSDFYLIQERVNSNIREYESSGIYTSVAEEVVYVCDGVEYREPIVDTTFSSSNCESYERLSGIPGQKKEFNFEGEEAFASMYFDSMWLHYFEWGFITHNLLQENNLSRKAILFGFRDEMFSMGNHFAVISRSLLNPDNNFSFEDYFLFKEYVDSMDYASVNEIKTADLKTSCSNHFKEGGKEFLPGVDGNSCGGYEDYFLEISKDFVSSLESSENPFYKLIRKTFLNKIKNCPMFLSSFECSYLEEEGRRLTLLFS